MLQSSFPRAGAVLPGVKIKQTGNNGHGQKTSLRKNPRVFTNIKTKKKNMKFVMCLVCLMCSCHPIEESPAENRHAQTERTPQSAEEEDYSLPGVLLVPKESDRGKEFKKVDMIKGVKCRVFYWPPGSYQYCDEDGLVVPDKKFIVPDVGQPRDNWGGYIAEQYRRDIQKTSAQAGINRAGKADAVVDGQVIWGF